MNDHFDGTHYFNPNYPRPHSFVSALKWRLIRKPQPWPKHVENESMDIPPPRVEGSDLRVSFIGHATVLLQTEGVNILTDPTWANRAGPYWFLSARRVADPGILFDDLPKIDVVLVSHNHYDHLDQPTLRRLIVRDNPLIVTPLGNEALIDSKRVAALDWGQSKEVAEGITVSLEPAQHWSCRTLWDVDRALWGSFVIGTSSGNIFFAADTGYAGGVNFRKIRAKFGQFRLSLLPIGTYEPRWMMQYSHLNPEEAVKAYQDLGARFAMAIHFATFCLADEGILEPADQLQKAKQKAGLKDELFRALKIGQSWMVPFN